MTHESFQPPAGFSTEVEMFGAYCNIASGRGLHGSEFMFSLKGPRGVVQLKVFTKWHTPDGRKHLKKFPRRDEPGVTMATVHFHSTKPMFEGQEARNDCLWLKGECYYDVSFSMSEDWTEDFIAGGTAWLWPKLLSVYNEQFTKGEQL